ncbi:MAG: P-type conjugative transfer protein VirB9 [Legionellales bacterium]|nr:P-type conjugative transfer protein VirB9 [Legionellales bacterium]
MNKFRFSLVLLATVATSHAQNNPRSFSTDTRIKQVVYQDNNVIPVQGVTFTTTQIQFGESERVLDIEGGDSAAWMVTYHPELSNMLFVKPTIVDSHTNMTVITNQHAYYFHLVSNKTLDKTNAYPTYALKFTYPKPTPTRTVSHEPSPPKALNTSYRFSGSPQLAPKHVFDDGQFTYFEFSTTGAVPAIFAIDNKNAKESTVNTRRQGKYIVVQRLAPQFTLRQGGQTTSVFNAREINRIEQNKRPQ